MTKLQRLQIGNNDCTGLELYNCPELTDLSTIGSHFTSLDLSGCPSLSLDFTSMTELEISDFPRLYALYCTFNEFMTSLKVSSLSNLGELQCYGNDLVSLEIDDCASVERLWCGDNRLESLDLSGLPYLRDLSRLLRCIGL